MHAPQIIVIVLLAINLAGNAVKDGEPTPPPHTYRFGVSLVRVAIWVSLLWWGGFFGGVA
jgi:hypothetical protein